MPYLVILHAFSAAAAAKVRAAMAQDENTRPDGSKLASAAVVYSF